MFATEITDKGPISRMYKNGYKSTEICQTDGQNTMRSKVTKKLSLSGKNDVFYYNHNLLRQKIHR
jgi:hypothetical protein